MESLYPDGLTPQKPEPLASRESRLHYLLARVTSYPRWLSIGGIATDAELHISRQLWEEIQEELRG